MYCTLFEFQVLVTHTRFVGCPIILFFVFKILLKYLSIRYHRSIARWWGGTFYLPRTLIPIPYDIYGRSNILGQRGKRSFWLLCEGAERKLIRHECALLLPSFALIPTLFEHKPEHRAWQVVGSRMLLSDHFSRRYRFPNGMPVCGISQPYSPA